MFGGSATKKVGALFLCIRLWHVLGVCAGTTLTCLLLVQGGAGRAGGDMFSSLFGSTGGSNLFGDVDEEEDAPTVRSRAFEAFPARSLGLFLPTA